MRTLRVIALLGLWLLSGCGTPTPSPQEVAFATQVPFRVLPGLHLVSPQIVKHGNFYSVIMGLDNESDEYIWFPNSRCGARSFMYSELEGRWIELQDKGIVVSEVEEILPPKGKDARWFTIIGVDPDIPPGIQPPVTIRVVVVGRIYRDGRPTDQEVGTYLDVTLQP